MLCALDCSAQLGKDPAFDLDHHLRRAVAPSPGGPYELDAVVSEIASVPLDRRHPLWELWIVDGLAEGRIGEGVLTPADLRRAEAVALVSDLRGWRTAELVP